MTAAVEVDYDIPITFPDGVRAYRWAMEILDREENSSLMDYIRQMLRKPGRFSGEDILDLAYTISAVEVQRIPSVPRTILRAVYVHERFPGVRSVAAQVTAQNVVLELEPRPRVTEALSRLAVEAMAAERRYRVKGQHTPQAAFARVAGVSRQGVRKGGWPEAITAVRRLVRASCDTAEDVLTDELAERGIVA